MASQGAEKVGGPTSAGGDAGAGGLAMSLIGPDAGLGAVGTEALIRLSYTGGPDEARRILVVATNATVQKPIDVLRPGTSMTIKVRREANGPVVISADSTVGSVAFVFDSPGTPPAYDAVRTPSAPSPAELHAAAAAAAAMSSCSIINPPGRFAIDSVYEVRCTDTVHSPILQQPDRLILELFGPEKATVESLHKSACRVVCDGNIYPPNAPVSKILPVEVHARPSTWLPCPPDAVFEPLTVCYRATTRMDGIETIAYPVQANANQLIFEHSGDGKGKVQHDMKGTYFHVKDGNVATMVSAEPGRVEQRVTHWLLDTTQTHFDPAQFMYCAHVQFEEGATFMYALQSSAFRLAFEHSGSNKGEVRSDDKTAYVCIKQSNGTETRRAPVQIYRAARDQ